MTPKTPSESRTTMTELVLPNDTNTLGNLMGGRLMHWVDICAAVAAKRHSNRTCVTAAVDHVEFASPVRLGEVVTLSAVVNRAFSTSMEIEVEVWAEDPNTGARRRCNRAFLTFVAVDERSRPVPVVPLTPDTDDARERHAAAAERRARRLALAGRS